MEIFINREDEDYGPYTVEEAQGLLASGDLLPQDYAWYEGAADWMALEEIPGIVPPAAAAPAPASAPKRTNTGLPSWIPPRRGDDNPTETGKSPRSFASPPRLGIVVPNSTISGQTTATSRAGPPRRSAATSARLVTPAPSVTPRPPVTPATSAPAPSGPPARTADVGTDAEQPGAMPVPAITGNLRSIGLRNMVIGGLVCIAGAAITIYSYESAASNAQGGSYTVAWGAVLFGAIQFLRGLMQSVKK